MLVKSLCLAIAKLGFSLGALAGPNVVVLLVDDVGYGDLSSHGNPDLKTPRLDALRAEGTAFERFFVSPTGVATRAAALTGRHEFAVGVSHTHGGRSLLHPRGASLAEVMMGAGRATGIFGKWGLGGNFPCRPEDRGFEEIHVHGGGGIGELGDFWGNGIPDPMIRRRDGWRKMEGEGVDGFFRESGGWMESQVAAEKPFFLWLAPPVPADWDSGEWIGSIDRNVGVLLERIDELGIEEETVVVFFGGNASAGTGWNAGMRGRKGSVHEGGVRVPCFVRWPGRVAAGRVVKELVGQVDLMPTLASLCGVELPERWQGDGADLSEALLGKREFPAGRMFFTHAGGWPGDERPERARARDFSVRGERWRMVGLELFDMAEDPGESTSVFAEHPEVVRELLTAYGQWWDSVAPELREPVRLVIGDARAPLAALSARDWWPSLEENAGGGVTWPRQEGLRDFLEKARVAKERNGLPGRSGHWKLLAARPGNYRIRMMLLPPEASGEERSRLGRLRPGTAHVRVGKEEMRLEVLADALAVTVMMDLDAGPLELEAWFEGQLDAGRKLGAFFVEVERTGERLRSAPEFHVKPIEKK